MKYLFILTALLFIGCSEKTNTIAALPESSQKVEIVEEVIVEPRVVQKNVAPRNEMIIIEPKVVKNVAKDVPSSCAMWSDGSNICTRVSRGKASCTTNPVENRMFSCLQWQ